MIAIVIPVKQPLHWISLDSWRSAWLDDPNLSFKLFVMVVIWACIGNGMMIFNANMKEIDIEVLEAAMTSGAVKG